MAPKKNRKKKAKSGKQSDSGKEPELDIDDIDALIKEADSLKVSEEKPPAVPEQNKLEVKIEYEQYSHEAQMKELVAMIEKDLSEPYSIFTYRYFIYNWPDLCILALVDGKMIGNIVCKADVKDNVYRGYIAMLAVEKSYRKHGIGSTLAQKAIDRMRDMGCDEVVLETEITNKGALRLYERLGFAREKRLSKYYLNGVDAFRLTLWFTPPKDSAGLPLEELTSE